MPRTDAERSAVAQGLPVALCRVGAAGREEVRRGSRTYLTETIRPLDVWCAEK
jgi:hypothetical protein